MKIDKYKSQHLVTVAAFDMDAGTATFEHDGWLLSVMQPNLRQAISGIRLGEPVVITVLIRYDQPSNPYRLVAIERLQNY